MDDVNPQMRSLNEILGTIKDAAGLTSKDFAEATQTMEEMSAAGATDAEVFEAMAEKGGNIGAIMQIF